MRRTIHPSGLATANRSGRLHSYISSDTSSSNMTVKNTVVSTTSKNKYATTTPVSQKTSPTSTSKPGAYHSSSYPSFLKQNVIAKLSLNQLREESLKYDLSKFPVAKIIHQSWKVKKLPPRFEKWSATWKKCFPDWEYRLWTDHDNDLLVKSFPWFYETYNALMKNIKTADAARYLYRFAFGGVYADLDTECLKPFSHLLSEHRTVFGAMEPGTVFGAMEGEWDGFRLKEGYVQNSFMYSGPGHPFWLDVVEAIVTKPKTYTSEEATGPIMLQEVINKWRQRMNKCKHNMCEVTIYPPKYFNPFSLIKHPFPDCKDLNRMTSADIEKCKTHFPDAYVIQYHAQT